ncbi:MAG: DUF4390 domain-containing protein [Betaproteobacteria bacterium HGW-Betaproteobacteria-22]|nr:MAG: DUF4390 domain-containing protein [Betaproteobacteria bacterium HGW-Betaproteobacteria-22]
MLITGKLHHARRLVPCFLKQLFCVLGLVLLTGTSVAASNSLHIRSANIISYEDEFLLNADAEINFSKEMEKAILKGFTFNFIIEFQLFSPRTYWFDDEIVTTVQQVSLSYHALTRQYILVRNEQQRALATLDEAMEDLSVIQDLKVFQKKDVEKERPYKAALMMRLDHKTLPKAMQVEGMSSNEWKMSSQRFEWVPNLLK